METTTIIGVLTRPLKINDDKRGSLIELFRNDWWKYHVHMIYISVTQPGQERGPHEHVRQTDMMAFVGPGVLRLRLADNRKKSKTYGIEINTMVDQQNPSLWVIPPGVIHGYRCISDIPAMMVNFPDALYMGPFGKEEVDEIRHEKTGLTLTSPFWIKK